jgi:hypothetical protein
MLIFYYCYIYIEIRNNEKGGERNEKGKGEEDA